ncbi:hypothetical protein FRC07_006497 [Ceratobasidium sp. 392]|nr:hypothetical protein FRC07_006497 [Ceratobasidium sp. 392]
MSLLVPPSTPTSMSPVRSQTSKPRLRLILVIHIGVGFPAFLSDPKLHGTIISVLNLLNATNAPTFSVNRGYVPKTQEPTGFLSEIISVKLRSSSILSRLKSSNSSVANLPPLAEPPLSPDNTRHRALYDSPPPDSQVEELPRSARSRTRTARALASTSRKRSRSQNGSASGTNQQSDSNPRPRKAQKQLSRRIPDSDGEFITSHPATNSSQVGHGDRAASKSPTPIPTADEPEAQSRREEVQELLARKFPKIVQNWGTQTLLDVRDALSKDPAYASQPEEQDTSTRFMAPTAVGTKGGFHLDHPAHRSVNVKTYHQTRKRLSYRQEPSEGDEGSATESDSATQDSHTSTPKLFKQSRSPSSGMNLPTYINNKSGSPSLGDPIPTPPASSQQNPNHLYGSQQPNPPASRRGSQIPSCSFSAVQQPTPSASHSKKQTTRTDASSSHTIPAQKQIKTVTRAPGPSNKRHHTPLPPPETSESGLELLPEFDEDEHVAEAAVKGVQIPPRHRKPTAQDLHGTDRVLWMVVRDVTWGFSMGQGNFQARGVFDAWLRNIYVQVYEERYPNRLFKPMGDDMPVVEKLLLRKPVQYFFELSEPTCEEQFLENKRIFNMVYPNRFHCSDPENDLGHYESEILPITLTALWFQNPTSLGARYPGLFEKTDNPADELKHLSIIAYMLTMIQYCLSEWANGFHEKGTLDANYLLQVFICHYDSVKGAAVQARKRLSDLYKAWFNNSLYVAFLNILSILY